MSTKLKYLGLESAKSFDHAPQCSFTWRIPCRLACSQMSLQLGMTSTNCLCIVCSLFQLLPQQPRWSEYIVNRHECKSLYRDSCEWQAKFDEIARITEVSSGICLNVKLNLAIY